MSFVEVWIGLIISRRWNAVMTIALDGQECNGRRGILFSTSNADRPTFVGARRAALRGVSGLYPPYKKSVSELAGHADHRFGGLFYEKYIRGKGFGSQRARWFF
jgi:hypothetical protein